MNSEHITNCIKGTWTYCTEGLSAQGDCEEYDTDATVTFECVQ